VTTCDETYLRAVAQAPAIRRVKERAYGLLELGPGSVVVDVGCGPAIDTVPLARIVGPTGKVLGIDRDPRMVELANAEALEKGVATVARHVVGDATALSIASASSDACFCDRMLQHLTWAEASGAIAEMCRILRPGGQLVLVDTDWASLSIAAQDPWLERRVVAEHALTICNPFAGRYLPALLRSAGAKSVSTETFSMQLTYEYVRALLHPSVLNGVISGRLSFHEADRWWRSLRESKEYLTFFGHVAMVLAVGTRTG
jgi:ubiquinone/menaquinone biosynthesis C-methylase UbiE